MKKKLYNMITYFLLLFSTLLIFFILFNKNQPLHNIVTSFFEVTENRTFDYRQSLKVMHNPPIPSDKIAILEIDDASLEILLDKYGEWPLPREIYVNILNSIEKEKPAAVIFDLIFLKSLKSDSNTDELLTNTLNKYDNVYVAMNFDDVTQNVRKAEALPNRLELNLENKSKINIKNKYSFTNCRLILDRLLNGNVKVGMTNTIRNEDGIIRKVAPIMSYQDKYYPYLSFIAASDYLAPNLNKSFTINSKGILNVKNTNIPLTEDGEAILNWYGPSGTHKMYPMYQLIKQMDNKNTVLQKDKIDLKGKIVLIGTTAISLHDAKSVPIQEKIYPGVEVHSTFINNMLDNNFVKRVSLGSNIAIYLTLIILSVGIVMLSSSTVFACLSTVLLSIAYLIGSYYVLINYNLWIPVTIPICLIVVSFAMSFIAKYLIKSKDFEEQYQLATIDGLTELYNHRYFQDTLRKQIDISTRYKQEFSLIMIDIDFFKQFNDKYGHQAGDKVLREVAQILKKNSRTTDYVCRYGGEEMFIILPNTGIGEAYKNAVRIRKAIEDNNFHINSRHSVNVTVSIGISTFPEDAALPQDLIEFADKGLYCAKENGRNQVVRYNKNEQE